uniref:Uncharacterized protein n=1 Tax=Oryza nivara TaxID=4536 RepID=A0A0E0HAG3_ORYNI
MAMTVEVSRCGYWAIRAPDSSSANSKVHKKKTLREQKESPCLCLIEEGFLSFGVFVAPMQIKATKIWLQIPLYDRLWF